MDADLALIKASLWGKDVAKSTLIKEVSRMVTSGDYQQAKRWIEDNLLHQSWYEEFIPPSSGRGRKGVICRIGFKSQQMDVAKSQEVTTQKLQWGNPQ